MVSKMSRFSFGQRRQLLERLQTEEFDVLIVGGGINGAGVLRDLCLRARPGQQNKFALIEKNHFATSASSKNSQLLHGGLRYLKYLDLGLVREALKERATLLRIAPHAAGSQPFLLPVYKPGMRLYYQTGVTLYDWLSGSQKLGRSGWLNAAEALQREPNLNSNGLRGAMLFWDARMHAPRLVLDQLRESVEQGAISVNFLEAGDPIRQHGAVTGVQARDLISGEKLRIRARVIVNTVGPWEKAAPLKLVRGSHLVFPQLIKGTHALAFFDEQGRILFVVPYGPANRFSLVGTTESAQKAPEPVRMDDTEKRYLIEQLARVLPSSAQTQPRGSYSALRPLLAGEGPQRLSSISRRHQVWKSAPNMYHLSGGKWTIFRLMAEELVDLLAQDHYPNLGGCRTEQTPIDGNTETIVEELRSSTEQLSLEYKVPLNTVNLIVEDYGRRAHEVLSLCGEETWKSPLVPPNGDQLPYVLAQVLWAKENEMTGRIEDFLTISTPLGYLLENASTAIGERLQEYFDLT